MVEIKKIILDKILEWSQPPYDASERIDKKIVAALLVACVGGEKLAQHEIEADAMHLIRSKNSQKVFIFSPSYIVIFIHRNNEHSDRIE